MNIADVDLRKDTVSLAVCRLDAGPSTSSGQDFDGRHKEGNQKKRPDPVLFSNGDRKFQVYIDRYNPVAFEVWANSSSGYIQVHQWEGGDTESTGK
jgi:hypothetical protein